MTSSRKKLSICFLALVVVSCFQTAWSQSDGVLQFTGAFMAENIGKNMKQLSSNMKTAMAGKLKVPRVQKPQKISVSCLNSVAPEPLNWRMWCPDSHANVTQWVDDVGSTHRKIQLQAMPNMNADMAMWFLTPMFPQTLSISGKTFTKNQLWHPLDHNSKRQEFKMAPGKGPKEPMVLMSKLDETYRPTVNSSRVYKTELWLSAMDLASNLPLNRYVVGYEVLGLQAFTFIVEFNDSPDGLLASIEVIIGAAAKGFDAKNPKNGVPPKLAKAVNTMLIEAVMRPYRANGDFDAALDAITRHVVEEFGNLPNFVPAAWASEQKGGRHLAPQLAEFKKNIASLVKPGGAQNATVNG